MGRKILRIPPSLLAQFFKDGSGMAEVTANPLPADARIVDARFDVAGEVVVFVVESASYPASNGLPYEEAESPKFRQTGFVPGLWHG